MQKRRLKDFGAMVLASLILGVGLTGWVWVETGYSQPVVLNASQDIAAARLARLLIDTARADKDAHASIKERKRWNKSTLFARGAGSCIETDSGVVANRREWQCELITEPRQAQARLVIAEDIISLTIQRGRQRLDSDKSFHVISPL